MTALLVLGLALLVGGLLYPLVATAYTIRQRQRVEAAFWEQVRARPGLFDWSEYPDL